MGRGLGITYLKKNGLPQEILRFIEENGGISFLDVIGKRTCFMVTLFSMYKRFFVKRLPFPLTSGSFIYYLDEQRAYEYGIEKSLIPASYRILMDKIKKNGAVSALELLDMGVSRQDLSWFTLKLVKNHVIKAGFIASSSIYFIDEDRFREYEKNYSSYIKSLESSFAKRAEKKGVELENMIASYYELLGFKVEKNKYFTCSNGSKMEIDVLATKPEIGLMIAIECKNYDACCLGSNIFLKISRIRDVLPRSIIHVYAKNISYYLCKSPFWKQNPDVFIFSGKRIHQIYETLHNTSLCAR